MARNIFTVSTLNEKMTEDQDGRPVSEESIRTLQIKKIKDRFIIYELFRKRKKPLRIMTIKKSKIYSNQNIIKQAIKDHVIFLKSKSTDTFRVFEHYRHTLKPKEKIRKYDQNIKLNRLTSKIYNKKGKIIGSKISFSVRRRGEYLGTTKQIQTNYIGRIKNFPQIIAYVQITDTKKEITDIFLGISRKMQDTRPSKNQIKKALYECVKMAAGKFFSVYGYYCKTGSLQTEIIDSRYLYWKKSRVAN